MYLFGTQMASSIVLIKNGQKKWCFFSGGPITGLPAVADDLIYIGSADHYLYALVA
jgi:outer membrane protein assembly factor BamB